MKDKEYIKKLIEEFFDGSTSNEEERELYLYFLQEDVDDELKKYTPLFQYFEIELGEEFKVLESRNVSEDISNRKRKAKLLYMAVAAIAASLLLGLIFNPFSSKNDFNPYEGSYVMTNGVKNYDLDADVLEQIESEILTKITQQQEKADKALNLLNEKENESDLYDASIAEKKTGYEKMINNINNKIEKYEEFIQTAD